MLKKPKTKNQKLKTTEGFTLVEMLIYVALMVALLFAVMQLSLGVSRSYKNIKAIKNVESSAVTAFERMTREIRGAKSIDISHSALGVNPGDLILNTTDQGGAPTTVEFYVNNGVLSLKSGGVYQGPLTTGSTTVSNLIFRRIVTSNSEGVKIEAEFRSVLGAVSSVEKFYSTIAERGSY